MYRKFLPPPPQNEKRTLGGLGGLGGPHPESRILPERQLLRGKESHIKDLATTPLGGSKNEIGGYSPPKAPKAPKVGAAEWSPEDWRYAYEERAGILEYDHHLPRPEAERVAFEDMVVRWMDAHPAPSRPGRCAYCGNSESPGGMVVPFGVEAHTWLHSGCWEPWYAARREQARKMLHQMGIGR